MRFLPLLLLLAACERTTPTAADVLAGVDSTTVLPVRESWGVRFRVSDDGRPRAELEAPYMASFEQDSTLSVFTGDSLGGIVTARLYDAEGNPYSTLTALRLEYAEGARRFYAEGGVLVQTDEGRRLETDSLTWFESERRVRAPGFARITTPDERLEGYGLVADEDLRNYRLERVTASVTVEG